MSSVLQPTPEQFRAAMERVLDFSESLLSRGGNARASDFSGVEEVLARVDEPEPRQADLEELLATLLAAASTGKNHVHPGFLAYVPISGAPITAIADYLAALLNPYVGVQWDSPAMLQMEWDALRWMSRLVGYPEQARGVFTSGGSLANFTAVVTARHARLGSNHAQGRMFVTEQAHHSLERAARICGLKPECIVTVATDGNLRLDPQALEDALARDPAGAGPSFLVVATGGTTNTGVVDPIEEIVEIAHRHGAWVHVDAAYGGAFMLTDHGRRMLRGIDQADSITLDPHKGFFLAMGMGCVLVRDGASLREAHAAEAAYLPETDETRSLPNLSDYSLELSRPFRGLRLWLALKLYGWAPFAEALDLNRSLAVRLHRRLSEDPRFEVPWTPDLSTVAFRLRDRGDAETVALMDAINDRGRVYLSSTAIAGKTYIRACFLSHRSSEATLDQLLVDIEESLRAR